jgi:hypothetical protein
LPLRLHCERPEPIVLTGVDVLGRMRRRQCADLTERSIAGTVLSCSRRRAPRCCTDSPGAGARRIGRGCPSRRSPWSGTACRDASHGSLRLGTIQSPESAAPDHLEPLAAFAAERAAAVMPPCSTTRFRVNRWKRPRRYSRWSRLSVSTTGERFTSNAERTSSKMISLRASSWAKAA